MPYLKIELLSDLCAGNGESVGNSVDTDVCMNHVGLPDIPSRRLKGCLKQSAYDLRDMMFETNDVSGRSKFDKNIDRLFGSTTGAKGCLIIQNAVTANSAAVTNLLTRDIPNDIRPDGSKGVIPDSIKKIAHPANVEKIFASVRGQTKLEEGVKVDNSLRFTRVIERYDPFSKDASKHLIFYAPVFLDTEDVELINLFINCCKATRHIGTNRTRGLGNVKISYHEGALDKGWTLQTNTDKQISIVYDEKSQYTISYKIAFEAPITLPGCDEINTAIPARSIIGCMAGSYLKKGKAEDEEFRKLFLDGSVRWSALTPVIDGEISDPVPMMLVKLKNADGRMINHLAETSNSWKSAKPKTMDGAFASLVAVGEGKKCYKITKPEIRTVYHNAINGTDANGGIGQRSLYMQDSISAGMIYGATVTCSGDMVEAVKNLIDDASFSFGRSKSAQYASCSLYAMPVVDTYDEKMLSVSADETVYVILKSDLAICVNGMYVTDNCLVRDAIANALGIVNEKKDDCMDYCRYHTIGGYNVKWQLQKPQIPVVKAGSIFCFTVNKTEIPSRLVLGEMIQEGFGECYIVRKQDLVGLNSIEKGEIDQIKYEESLESKEDIYKKLLYAAGLEVMQEYAFGFIDNTLNVPVGRLRLMLSEAHSYSDLVKMISNIKESDLSSEKKVSRKSASLNLVMNIYADKNKEFSLKKMFEADMALWKEIDRYEDVKEQLETKWKKPLEIVLHAKHYKKER